MQSIAEKIKERQDRDEVNQYIINQRDNGLGYREICKGLKSGFGLSMSHTSLSKYVEDYLKDSINEPTDTELPTKHTTMISEDRVNELMAEMDGWIFDRVAMMRIKAQIIALIEANINDHLQGLDRLKVEYVKYLKDLESIAK
jgi:hypothetical protein